MGIKDLLERFRHKNELYEQIETQQKAVHKLEQKQLSADERELQRYMKEKRDALIHARLESERKKRVNEWWHEDVINQKNLFTEQKNKILGWSLE
jgi:hypothetical protein